MKYEGPMQMCTRCERLRREDKVIQRRNRAGKLVWRCRKRSVCASRGRRLRGARGTGR